MRLEMFEYSRSLCSNLVQKTWLIYMTTEKCQLFSHEFDTEIVLKNIILILKCKIAMQSSYLPETVRKLALINLLAEVTGEILILRYIYLYFTQYFTKFKAFHKIGRSKSHALGCVEFSKQFNWNKKFQIR